MRKTESDKKRTDKAWEKLNERLTKERLLTPHPQRILPMWKATAILIIGILSVLSLLTSRNTDPTNHFVTIHNTETATTSVTLLEDGSIVCLDGQASLTYPVPFPKGKREVALNGSAMFHVAGNPECPFRIKNGTTEVEVLGTTFYIKSDNENFLESGVKNGKVKINLSEHEQPIYLTKGEKIRRQGKAIQLQETTVNDFKKYTQCLRFKDEPLSHVLKVINSLSLNKDIRLEASDAIANRRLTFTYTNNTLEDLTKLLSTALGITYHQKGTYIIFTEQKP